MANKTEILVNKAYKQIAVVTLITSVLWVLMAVYKAVEADYPTDVKPAVLEQLNPTISQDLVESLTTRTQLKEVLNGYSFPSPTPAAEKLGNARGG